MHFFLRSVLTCCDHVSTAAIAIGLHVFRDPADMNHGRPWRCDRETENDSPNDYSRTVR
jgi:hypothetical protein